MRSYMILEDLLKAGAVEVLTVRYGSPIGYVDPSVLTEPGFYFMVKGNYDFSLVAARFYVGRQRSKSGFMNVLSQIRQGRSQLGRTMNSNGVVYTVYFIPANKMKPLTTGFGKGQMAMAFTRQHNDSFQNLEEMNRMLNDNFKFTLQSY